MGGLEVDLALFVGFHSVACRCLQALRFLLLFFSFGLGEGRRKALKRWQRLAIIHWRNITNKNPLEMRGNGYLAIGHKVEVPTMDPEVEKSFAEAANWCCFVAHVYQCSPRDRWSLL
jgi:hypothetical protein